MKNKKSLLIIGATGFFGKTILNFILNNYYYKKKFSHIFLLSRNPEKLKISHNTKNKINIKYIKRDIHKAKSLPYADYVLYLATSSNSKKDYEAISNYVKIAQIIHKKSKILFTSSGAVYGVQPVSLESFDEKYLTKKIIPYDKGYKKNYSKYKMLSEKKFLDLGKKNYKVTIARCFTFVGRYLPTNKNFVVGNIMNQILNNKTISLKANYLVMRSFMYDQDMARWILKILFNAGSDCPIYNLGSDNAISVQKLIKMLSSKFNLPYKIKKITNKKKIDKYVPNINLIKKKLDLDIKTNSFEAVCRTIENLKLNL